MEKNIAMANRMRQLKITKSITNRESWPLEKYLQEIGKEGMITQDMEVQLTQRIKQGDTLALQALCKANLRFVVSVAKQYQNQGLTLPDLISEGNLGLVKAATRFDETRGFKFISYAVWWIRQQILESIATQSRIVRLPLNQTGTLGKINKAFAKLEQEFERPPSAEELAELLEISSEKVRDTLKVSGKHVSLDAPLIIGEPGSNTMLDVLQSDDGAITEKRLNNESLRKDIEHALSKLTEQERNVLELYFGIGGGYGLTLEEIGAIYDLTRERIRQIKEKGIRRLRHTSRSALLRAYLG